MLIKYNVLLLIIIATGFVDAAPVSKLWQQYEAEKKAGKTTWLPDFSYAGYQRGESEPETTGKIFNVTDFGAFPDDLKDDRQAIQKAINAAEKNGGGIVFLPKGRYLVNTTMATRGMIKVKSGNIIIKGAGSTAGGTVIHTIEPYGGGHPHLTRRLYFGESVFLIRSVPEDKSITTRKTLTEVTGDAPRETFSLNVNNTKLLKPGQIVYLYALNKAIHTEMIKPYSVDPTWTTITQNKAYAVEIHRIKAIDGKQVKFFEPLRYNIRAEHGWTLRQYQPISNVGVEDICFMGNSYHRYKHHRSGYDDSGWAFIKMKGVTDGWVRRCSFINCNQTVLVAMSLNVSLLNLIVAGNKGHHIARSTFLNYGVFAGLMEDRAGFDHGPSLNWGCTGTVFWRCKGNSPIDSHAGRPYVTLFDNISAPGFNSSGGKRDYPQHLRFMVVWNMENTKDKQIEYDFWVKGKNNCFLNPIITGIHGKPIGFVKEKLEILESPGTTVKPESLYEAQLKLRLNKLPAWISAAKHTQRALEKQNLPEYYDRNNPASKPFLYKTTFKVDDLLQYATTLSLQMYNSKLFTYKLADKSLTMHTDRGFARNTLYSLMYCIYQHKRYDDTIAASETSVGGKKFIKFIIQSGKTDKIVDLSQDPYYLDARKFAAVIGGNVKFIPDKSRMVFEVLLPVKN